MTAGVHGLQQHPLETHATEDGLSVRIGQPVRFSFAETRIRPWANQTLSQHLTCAGISADGETMAVAFRGFPGQVSVLDPIRNESRSFSGQYTDVAVSADGQWVVASNYRPPVVQIWHAESIWNDRSWELAHEISTVAANPRVSFSPDNRWLIVSDGVEYGFWDTGTWELSMSVPRQQAREQGGPIAFSPDGAVVALARTRYMVQLIDIATGLELTTLEPFHSPDIVKSLCFSPDGTKLVVACQPNGLLVWDLRLLREQLSAMGLDWDAPPLAAEED